MKIFYHMSTRVHFRSFLIFNSWECTGSSVEWRVFSQLKPSSNARSSPTVRKSLLSIQPIVVLYPETFAQVASSSCLKNGYR